MHSGEWVRYGAARHLAAGGSAISASISSRPSDRIMEPIVVWGSLDQNIPRITRGHGRVEIPIVVHEGKQRPKARRSRGEPLMRILRRKSAQSKLRSLARNPSQVELSAKTCRSGMA